MLNNQWCPLKYRRSRVHITTAEVISPVNPAEFLCYLLFGHFCQFKMTKSALLYSYIEDVLRLIRGQNVDGDLLTVGEADVEGDFFCGNLLRLLWEGHGDNTQQSWLCAVFSFLWVNNETAIKTHQQVGGGRFLFLETNATFMQD